VNIKENNLVYKEMVEKKTVIIEEKIMDGYITIQQNRENPNTIDIFPKKIIEIDEEKEVIMNIIATQNMLDKQYEDYKKNYIEL
jgi:predicted metal-dependent hydrolase